ncbi:Zinc finger RING-type protein [Macrophomina phaseolina MS6]|uniref:Zinc finger RING-type protein n=1 Tax=Macrophomina phaseolina (strain MS6) TaxID=1126212 RepID=K2QYD7_MACPH|nr:Zinc finger RING-type protein [Macrophomina phaseolina MS6]
MDPNELFPASSRTTRQKTPNDSASTASQSSTPSARTPHDMAPQKPGAQHAAKGSKAAAPARPPAKLMDTDRATRTASKDSLKAKQPKKPEDQPKPDKNEELLKVFRSDLDSLRSLVTCKICDRLLYEPYVISCGHTYCYSCLCTWFVNNRSRKTCPDCRALVVQPPAPAYLIREMTSIFINRAELLPPGEAQDLHKQWQKEEADLVLQDKNNEDVRTGGLFKGCFRVRAEPGLRAIRDEEDGVDRCPMCAWELEGGECAQCGLQFDDNGTLTWGNSFGGFSDMDETSEHDMSSEDLDGELELEDNEADLDFDGYGDDLDDWQDQFDDDDHSYAVRRWLANEALARPHQPFGLGPARRRPAAHSAAGSRRRSYSASLVSDMMTEDTEMGNIEEEDEEDGDSSMNDFIDDGDPETASQGTNSTDDQTPNPPYNNRSRRSRRVVESESSSGASHQPDEDEDNDDEGPIAPGRRRLQQLYRPQLQSGFRRRQVAPSSSAPEDASIDQDLDDEDTQALLYQAGWSPLGHEGDDDEMDEDDDSDGGRTTVGWEPIANSVERSRFGGSLTPTADRPGGPIRPPSRVGNPRFLDGSRGLRRRSSVLSAVSSTNYEDGEADDDDSDVDRDGDSSMRSPVVRPRGSRVRLRNNTTSNNSRPSSSGFSAGNSGENDTDENSDDTAAPGARRRPRLRAQRQEYDPRISWAFAQHMAELRDLNMQQPEAFLDHLEQLRATTPVARPRTSNRNRTAPSPLGPHPQFSPLSNGPLPPFSPPSAGPARLRTPISFNSVSGSSMPMSPRSERSQGSTSQASVSTTDAASNVSRRTPSSSGASSVTMTSDFPQMEPNHGAEFSNGAGQQADTSDSSINRSNTRTPSSTSRRNSGIYQGPISPGLNFAARFQAQHNRNPWNPFVPLSPMRPRQSVQRLRDQSSTATLRPRNSQRGLRQQPSQSSMRDNGAPAQHIRQQNSRVNLRSQPSQNRLSSQASSRTLRANNNPTVMHQSNASTSSVGSNSSQRSRLTEEERLSRARELVISRQQALQGGGTNPFAAGRRQTTPGQSSNGSTAGSVRSQYSVSSAQSLGSSSPASLVQPVIPPPFPNSQPTLGRRRSNRNVGAPPGAFIQTQPTNNTFNIRARSGSVPGTSPYGEERGVSFGSEGITAGGNSGHY